MRIGLRCMEVVEWENEGDSTHEKVVRFAWKCVAWGLEMWRLVDGVKTSELFVVNMEVIRNSVERNNELEILL